MGAVRMTASDASASSSAVKRHLVRPGEHFVTREPLILTTLLGSCVSVCLYDPVARLMGMNHFLLPMRNPAGREPMLASDAGRYGLWAMELLVNDLLKLGARRDRLRAKAFGGGNVLQGWTNRPLDRLGIGTANVRFVRQFLDQDGIPLVAEDLGGADGRQIHFYGGDYSVYLRRIPRTKVEPVLTEERKYLEKAMVARQRAVPTDFF